MFEEFYGLSGRPFQLTPDPAFYFESLTHRKALSYLGYGLAQGEGFVVITGEVGAGKSTLVAHLMATVDPARLTAAQVVTSKLDGEEIVHVIAQAFGLPIEGHDKASALGAIEAFLHDEARAGRRCLLIVDEAQNLAIEALEELRMLSNFQLGSHPLLQTLLLGQPEFRETMLHSPALEQLRQRVIATHHLDAMQPGEVQPYIEHRLKCVGWQGNPAFAPDIFAELHAASGGVPRRINQIANRLMLMGSLEQSSTIDAAMLHRVLTEMDVDGSLTTVTPVSGSSPVVEVQDSPEIAAGISPEIAEAAEQAMQDRVEQALAERDLQIAELRQAVAELSAAVAASTDAGKARDTEIAAFQKRTADLEALLAEQDRTLRDAIGMLLEWVEYEGQRVAA